METLRTRLYRLEREAARSAEAPWDGNVHRIDEFLKALEAQRPGAAAEFLKAALLSENQ